MAGNLAHDVAVGDLHGSPIDYVDRARITIGHVDPFDKTLHCWAELAGLTAGGDVQRHYPPWLVRLKLVRTGLAGARGRHRLPLDSLGAKITNSHLAPPRAARAGKDGPQAEHELARASSHPVQCATQEA